MIKSIFKREEENTLNVQERYLVKQDIEDDDATFVLLQKLETDEAKLNEQKGNLSSLLNQLQLKVEEEVQNRKRRVQTLNSEVTELKRKCEKFAKWASNSEVLK
jgi:hypothetical protein